MFWWIGMYIGGLILHLTNWQKTPSTLNLPHCSLEASHSHPSFVVPTLISSKPATSRVLQACKALEGPWNAQGWMHLKPNACSWRNRGLWREIMKICQIEAPPYRRVFLGWLVVVVGCLEYYFGFATTVNRISSMIATANHIGQKNLITKRSPGHRSQTTHAAWKSNTYPRMEGLKAEV